MTTACCCLAYLNSHFQTGLKNVLDRAVLAHEKTQAIAAVQRVSKGRRNSVRLLAAGDVGGGAYARRQASAGLQGSAGGDLQALHDVRIGRANLSDRAAFDRGFARGIRAAFQRGFRVLAIAFKDTPADKMVYSKEDECAMVLRGYIAFLDPPKETALPAIEALRKHGVAVKVLTGDNDLVSRKICSEVGIPTEDHAGRQSGRADERRRAGRGGGSRRRFLPGSRPPTSSGSSRRCKARGTWWASWETASTTLRLCGPPTWAFRSIRPSISPRNRPT